MLFQSFQVDHVGKYLYPGSLSVSILCLILTFLLYSVLPQLRDLTGKFILGICGCSVAAFSLILIDIFGSADENVHNLTTGRIILALIRIISFTYYMGQILVYLNFNLFSF